ncbi:MAG: hypothetical protein Q7R50_08540 [Dehalococcoidales bacterium]|nr:hypothetical protein [Dehalococcoidales bacterium]
MKKLFITMAAVLTLVASTLPAVLAQANDAGPLDSVAISPAPALVAVNGTQQFTAVSKDAANQTVSNVTCNWSVVAGGGTINATSGLFTAGNDTGTFNGTVQVTAVQGNITVTAVATVTVAVPGQLVSLVVSPTSALVATNGTQQFTAVAKDAFDQNATSVNYTWAVVAGGGTVDNSTGLFTAANTSGTFNGTVQVTAVQGNITKTANATVIVAIPGQLVSLTVSPAAVIVPVNGAQQFTAVAKDAFNQNATGVNLTWSVVAGGGTINSTSGLFTAGNTTGTFNGTVQVTAVQGSINQTANATVIVGIHGVLDHVVISPANATVVVNGTRQFTAVAKDAFNSNVSNVTYNWSVVAGGGSINATSGLFTAGNTTGTFNGTIQVNAVQGNITVTAVATVTVAVKSGDKHRTPPGWEKGKKKGWDDDDNPPGWDHGKKKGWDDEHTPPGLAKGDDDDDECEREAEHKQAKPADSCTGQCQDNDDTDHGNAGDNPAAGNAGDHGKKGED